MTDTLVIAFRARNGRRIERRWPIEREVADDPVRRANAVSAYADLHAADRMVNWHVEDGVREPLRIPPGGKRVNRSIGIVGPMPRLTNK